MAVCRGECGKRLFKVTAVNKKGGKDNTKITKTNDKCPNLGMNEALEAIRGKLDEQTNKKVPTCKKKVCQCAKYKSPPYTDPVETKLKNFAVEKTVGKGKKKRECGYKITGSVMVSSAPEGVCQTKKASGVVQLAMREPRRREVSLAKLPKARPRRRQV